MITVDMIPVEYSILSERIREKLKKHDKSLFTQAELNFLNKLLDEYPAGIIEILEGEGWDIT